MQRLRKRQLCDEEQYIVVQKRTVVLYTVRINPERARNPPSSWFGVTIFLAVFHITQTIAHPTYFNPEEGGRCSS
jgi:hypothetical protein